MNFIKYFGIKKEVKLSDWLSSILIKNVILSQFY